MFLSISFAAATSAFAAVAPDEVLVRFRPGAPESAAARALEELGGRSVDTLPSLRVRRVKLPPGRTVDDALARLRAHPLVELAEPNMIIRAKALPPDPYLVKQWALDRIKATQAWAADLPGADGSASIIIAIVDSGVWSQHAEFQGKLVPGYNALDDSGNTEDDHGHGTGVASVAAAVSGTGMVGVARNARIMPIRVLSAAGEGTEFSIVKGVLWAANHGAKVINMSLGSCDEEGCVPGSVTGAEAMEQAHGLGAVLIAATGNEGTAEFSYPAGYPYVIGVGATDATDQVTFYSNTGPAVDVVAPGGGGSQSACDAAVDILAATIPPYFCGISYPGATLVTEAGTSFSSPIVAGLAAVLLGVDPTRTPDQIAALIQRTADQPAGHTSWNPTYGYGRVNMYRALTGSMAAPPTASDTGWAWPNPFSPTLDRHTTFTVPGGSGQDVRVSIFDQAGHLIWEAAYSAAQTAGMDLYSSSPIRWNGRDSAGVKAAGGVYLARITAGGTSSVKKIVLAP